VGSSDRRIYDDCKNDNGDDENFTGCVALVEGGRVLGFQSSSSFPFPTGFCFSGDAPFTEFPPVAGTLKEFKDEVMRLPTFAKTQSEPTPSWRSWAYFVNLIPSPPPTSAKGTLP